jgi:hypothetical protein
MVFLPTPEVPVPTTLESPTEPEIADGFWGGRLDEDDPAFTWLWEGYLAPGNVTLLTSQWKSGKTTLVSILLSRLREGGELAGLPIAPAKAVVVSEESRQLWQPRHKRLGLGHVYFFCRPFNGKPSPNEWAALIERIALLREKHGVALVVIDTLATFLPGRSEANAAVVMTALLPLQRLTRLGMAVLLLHHPAKGVPLAGQAARGSGALSGFVDIIVEMNWCAHAGDGDRRRKLLAFSRHDRTPGQRVLELNAEATDYLTHGDFSEDDFAQNWQRLHLVFEDAADKLTRRQLLADWPADFPCPADITLWRWLQRGTELGLIRQEGSGRKSDPFRYWLPEQEARWKQDPMWEFNQMMNESRKIALEGLGVNAPLPESMRQKRAS